MDTKLPIDMVKNLCRICLSEGRLNIWECKIDIPKNNATMKGGNAQTNEDGAEKQFDRLPLFEMLQQIFGNGESTVLDFSFELPLICHLCLIELLPFYVLNKKMEETNKQINRLYREARCTQQTNETDSRPNLTKIIHDAQRKIGDEGKRTEELLLNAIKNLILTGEEKQVRPARLFLPLDKGEQKETIVDKAKSTGYELNREILQSNNKMKNKPTFILTESLTQLMAHIYEEERTTSEE